MFTMNEVQEHLDNLLPEDVEPMDKAEFAQMQEAFDQQRIQEWENNRYDVN